MPTGSSTRRTRWCRWATPRSRRQSDPDGGPLLCGERGAGGGHCQSGEGQRRHHAAGGAFKPRTSPYSFQGLGATGLEYLKVARQETGLPIVTELMDLSQLPLFKDVDVIQIGARNMQNFDLLKAVGIRTSPS